MIYLVLHESSFSLVRGNAVVVTVKNGTFETFSEPLVRQRDKLLEAGVDSDIIDCIYYCRARNPNTRPDLIRLAMGVHERVLNRGPGSNVRETDEAIKQMMATLILDGDTRLRGTASGDDEDDPMRPRESDGEMDIV